MDDELHFWTIIGLEETRIPELKRLENQLNGLQLKPLDEDRLLDNTDALIRTLETLCKTSYPILKTIDLKRREMLVDCVWNKWQVLKKELKRILPCYTWRVLSNHAQVFTKLCRFNFDQRPLMFAEQALAYKDMPRKLELELIQLIDQMRAKHPHVLDDILDEEYQAIKKGCREKIRITVLGSTKSSKSSLINFLLEKEICPTGNQSATARLTRITYGKEIRLTVGEKPPRCYSFNHTEELLEKAKEVIILKNEDRKSKLCEDVVLIELPINELKGIELWDIPGFDENHVINHRITEILQETDLILAVLSHQESLRQTAIDFIKPCLQQTVNNPQTKICFIISQIDRFKPDEQTKESQEVFLQHIYDKICEELPTNFPKDNYQNSNQLIPMCSSPRHSIKDYLQCREEFISKSCRWFYEALDRLTHERTDLLLKCLKEFSNYENIFRQQTRYERTRQIFNTRFLSFTEELTQKVNKKLSEIPSLMRESIENIVCTCRDLFSRSESLESIEEYIQEQLSRKFEETLAAQNPELVQMVSQMSVDFSNTIELKPPETQILKQALIETLNKDYHSNIIGQYHHTSRYHLSAYLNRLCHALSETLKATIKIPYGDFETVRRAYGKLVPREKYVEEKTMSSISNLVNEVLDLISEKLQAKIEKTLKKILTEQLEQIHERIDKQVQIYLHSSRTDIKINHLRQFYTEHSLQIKRMHLDVLDVQFQLDFSSTCEITHEQSLTFMSRFPVFFGTLSERKVPIAAKLIPLKNFRLQEVLYIREVKQNNVIKYYGVKKGDDNQYYIIMQRLDCNLAMYLKDHSGTFDPPTIDNLIIQIINGLDYIHTQLELIHGDIRLENILVNQQKKRFLIAHLGGSYRESNTQVHVNAYTAPELRLTNNLAMISEKSDVYSLGIMIEEIIRLAKVAEHDHRLIVTWLNLSRKCCTQELAVRPNCKKLLEQRLQYVEQ